MSEAADKQKASKVPVWEGVIAYFSNALNAVGAISRFGSVKHNDGKFPTKWREYSAPVYANALARHIVDECRTGDLYDRESNMLHAAHEAWNALARLEKLLELHPLYNEPLQLQQARNFPGISESWAPGKILDTPWTPEWPSGGK